VIGVLANLRAGLVLDPVRELSLAALAKTLADLGISCFERRLARAQLLSYRRSHAASMVELLENLPKGVYSSNPGEGRSLCRSKYRSIQT
jgi:hypothetical protein